MDPNWLQQYDAGVPQALSYPDRTLSQLLTQSASQFPDHHALRFYGGHLSYRELSGLVDRFATGLRAVHGKPGGVVGLMLPNLPQTVIGFFGGLRAGAVVTPINPLYVEAEIAQQVNDAGCETVVALDQFYPRLAPLIGKTSLKRVVVTRPQEYLPWLKRLLYPLKAGRQGAPTESLDAPPPLTWPQLLRQVGDLPVDDATPDALALLQYTGGTTGTPKGVMLTHRNLIANAWQCRSWMPTLREGDEVFLGVLPFFHVYGMSVCQNIALTSGSTLVVLPRFQVTEVLETIVNERVTIFPGIPAMYQALTNNAQSAERFDLRTVRICISGAGPLQPSVQKRFEAMTGARLVEGYGLTEAGPVTHVNPINCPAEQRRVRSIGVPVPGTEAKIVDMETGGRELPFETVGELIVRGPQVMQGYWRREEETRHVLRDGWLYTGDLARRDQDGYFYLEDRKKDMIKSGGENVYPREVEDVLLRHPKVKEAVVVGLPRGLRGELIKAYVVLREGTQATVVELLEHCRRDLAKFKVPKRVEFRKELPKTLVGKVLRRVLIEEERQKAQAAGDKESPPEGEEA